MYSILLQLADEIGESLIGFCDMFFWNHAIVLTVPTHKEHVRLLFEFRFHVEFFDFRISA
jgi:hypothetical protein